MRKRSEMEIHCVKGFRIERKDRWIGLPVPQLLTFMLWSSEDWQHACPDREAGAIGAVPQGTTWSRDPLSVEPFNLYLWQIYWPFPSGDFYTVRPGWELWTGVLALLLKGGEGKKYERSPVNPISDAQRLSPGPLTKWLCRWITSRNKVGLSCMGLVKIWRR